MVQSTKARLFVQDLACKTAERLTGRLCARHANKLGIWSVCLTDYSTPTPSQIDNVFSTVDTCLNGRWSLNGKLLRT